MIRVVHRGFGSRIRIFYPSLIPQYCWLDKP
jgi:hypothetical protein